MFILDDIKEQLGYLSNEDDDFNNEILAAINTSIAILMQLGVGAVEGIEVTKETKWSDIFGKRKDLQFIRQYVYLDSKLAFDPPGTGPKTQALERRRDELTFRINVQAETPAKEV